MDIEKQRKILEIAKILTDGDISKANLICPYCFDSQMVFSFTKGEPPFFGLFIDCKNCGHREHFILSPEPCNFDPKYVLPEYQYLEDQLVILANRKGRSDFPVSSDACKQ